ncbi:hypothetical protein [Halalkalibacter oceani]|uniref:Uncharacterized protein n=1 Tax=Halalkalibacter oceani TaxID=1653776 RepID=A0A9X2DM24_9BACI|nr:hypothetical protein [Halalkalibacter oceani]MCM3712981.1 hypothetical protein [Halalkalibacter oceani]MCM3759232.1 hypothetical protein [Halalkalibacter oceani]
MKNIPPLSIGLFLAAVLWISGGFVAGSSSWLFIIVGIINLGIAAWIYLRSRPVE